MRKSGCVAADAVFIVKQIFQRARGPRRSLHIEWRWYNVPYLASSQAPWYQYVLFGEDEFAQFNFPPEGYRIIVGFDGDWSTDSDN
jgi:hypothetical protein